MDNKKAVRLVFVIPAKRDKRSVGVKEEGGEHSIVHAYWEGVAGALFSTLGGAGQCGSRLLGEEKNVPASGVAGGQSTAGDTRGGLAALGLVLLERLPREAGFGGDRRGSDEDSEEEDGEQE